MSLAVETISASLQVVLIDSCFVNRCKFGVSIGENEFSAPALLSFPSTCSLILFSRNILGNLDN